MQDHLRSVPPSGEEETKARARQRPRATKALPTDRMKFDSQTAALRAIVLESANGTQAVGSKEIANRLSMSPATAGLNNAFFVEAGLITREGKGRWKPTEAANEFRRQHSFDPVTAGRALAQPLKASWYFREVQQQLAMGPTTVSQMVEVLARAAGASSNHLPQLRLVLEWLEYAGLITTDGDQLAITNGQPPPEPDPSPSDPPPPPADQSSKGTTDKTTRQPPVLTFNFDFELTAADLAALSPEQIQAVFEAVGRVAAIKAS